ncbi:MAG TPA: hypothetical protein VGS00_07905 [Thermoanaerobaculia bacterium]|nr:hypothetical protein [Thermoanaerobaculia bacterium]
MKKSLSFPLVIVLVLSATSSLLAQTPAAPGGPPKVLQIFREEVKPGKSVAHEKWETGWPRAFAKANWPTRFLAITSLSGPSEAWFLTGHESFAAWEKDRQNFDKAAALKAEDDRLSAGDGEFLSASRSIVAALREDLSNKPNITLGKMRYFRIVMYRVRPGHETDFADAAKIVREAYEKAKVDFPWAVYQIVSGMPGPTYLVFAPMKSLEEIDAAQARSKTIQEAEGEENGKKLQKLSSDGFLTTESNIYAFSPKMSYVAPEVASADPDFWTPKPAAAPAAKDAAKDAAKEKGKKPAKP